MLGISFTKILVTVFIIITFLYLLRLLNFMKQANNKKIKSIETAKCSKCDSFVPFSGPSYCNQSSCPWG